MKRLRVNNTVETDESMGMTSLTIIIDPVGSYGSDCKVVCVFPMAVVSILPHVEFGPNYHWKDAPHVRCAKFFLPMNDSLPKVANLFSWKDLLDIIFLLDCSIMQPLRFQHVDQNPIS